MELLLASGEEDELIALELRLRSLGNRVRTVLSGMGGGRDGTFPKEVEDLDEVSDDEIFEMIDKEIGMA
ncbi:hypothetical protein NKH18_14850 [Streptomyces sp. M10(2022)]